MTGLLTECEKHFHCDNLYNVLGVDRLCKPAELRKAFYKMSLLHHPDRHEGQNKIEATQQFQILSKVYAILSDDEKRKVYDETGIVDEDDTVTRKSYEDWMSYWQLLFPRVTAKQIDDFCNKYKGSEQELVDLAGIYERYEGDMDAIMETMLFASHDDESRVRELIDGLIKEGKVTAYDAYTNESPTKSLKRAKRAEKEKQLFARDQKKRAKTDKREISTAQTNDMDALASAIMANRDRHLKATENLLDRLTEKYCKPTSTKTKRSSTRANAQKSKK